MFVISHHAGGKFKKNATFPTNTSYALSDAKEPVGYRLLSAQGPCLLRQQQECGLESVFDILSE